MIEGHQKEKKILMENINVSGKRNRFLPSMPKYVQMHSRIRKEVEGWRVKDRMRRVQFLNKPAFNNFWNFP